MNLLAERCLRPITEFGSDRPHGRVRYMAGCRCGDCRRANTEYARMRRQARARGDWRGLVDATAARLHLRKLSHQGVGRRAVSAATDIRDELLFRIRTGRIQRIHANTEQKILAVTPIMRSDRALVPAARTWRLINELLEEGWTKKFIAKQLGYSRALQLNKHRVTVKNAARVERLYRRLMT